MRVSVLLTFLLVPSGALLAAEKDKGKGRAKPAPAAAQKPETAEASGKAPKARVHTFSALDVEGKLKTPQLLFFRSRMKQELDSSTPGKRSFLKELEQSADDKGL